MSKDFEGPNSTGGVDEYHGPDEVRCSFCGRDQLQVHKLVSSPTGGAFICDECVAVCGDIVFDELADSLEGLESAQQELLENLPTPKELHAALNEYVIGQDQAKKILSVAVHNHYKRVALGEPAADEDTELAKSNILLLGPTGTGKTLLAQTLARVLNVPFAIADATALTEAGYVGEDVENILLKIITAADYDVERAQIGIIYVDEIDKIARKAENLSITRDVSGEGVQQALLKIIEGTEASVPPQGGRKHPQQELIKIDTTNILFIMAGAFVGLDRIVADRIGKKGVGFSAELTGHEKRPASEYLGQVLPEDLHSFGLIPEFVGRMPVITSTKELSVDDLVHILTEPKNALVKQYKRLFRLEDVELEFTQEALEEIARQAIKHGTGARGLRSICENLLLDLMYELPSETNIESVSITLETVLGTGDPIIKQHSKRKSS